MQSCGKTLLGDVIGIIATGRDATSISVPKELDEMRKRLTSTLLAGDLVVSLDNVVRPLECEALATITTKEEYGDRILGTMNMAKVRTNVLFLVTGNNLVFSGDLPSRVIISRIDPKVEKPEERGGWNIPDLRQYVHDHRPQIVHAILTILRAHYVKGRPGMGLTPFGRFEVWTSQIRSALVWAGFADPVITRKSVVDNDPERDRTVAVLTAWSEHPELGLGKAVTIKQVIQAANSLSSATKAEAIQADNLRTALMEVAQPKRGGSEEPNSQLLGTWCNNHFDRPVEGLVLVKAGKDTHLKTALWAVKNTVVWAAEVAGTAGTCVYRSSPSARENETHAHNNGNHNNDDLNTSGADDYPQDPAVPANPSNGSAPKDDREAF
jgi:putative DNA primase/helicase